MRETEMEVLLCENIKKIQKIVTREIEAWDHKKDKKERNNDNWN